MADLHKFIRQQFSNNNWSKECDLSKIPRNKLKEMSEAFNQLDVKSKLTLTFTYANSVIPSDPIVAQLVESVILQALDEDNNFVRCVATVLHSRQNFGHLLFDLSDTSDSFAKTLASLTSCTTDDHILSKIPPLAELLDARFTDGAMELSSYSSKDLRSNCLNSFCGFTIRDKTPAQLMKESYLDRLQEECERRRVHVPIPGHSFGKQGFLENVSHNHIHSSFSESSLGSHRAPSFPRRSVVPRKTDINDGETSTSNISGTFVSFSTPLKSSTNTRVKLLAMRNRGLAAVTSTTTAGRSESSGSNIEISGSHSRRMMLLSSSATPDHSERSSLRHLNVSGASAIGNKRSSGIKLLDFQDLPAIGLQAKKLRKEQQEKEREEKRKDRELKAQERREARDAACLARIHAQSFTPTTTGCKKMENPLLSSLPHPISSPILSQPLPRLQPTLQQLQRDLGAVTTTTKSMSWDLQQPWTPFGAGPTCSHHRGRQSNRQGGTDQNGEGEEVDDDDDEDYADDDEEECGAVVGADGTFHLTAPQGFRGFTDDPLPNSIALQSQQAAAPTSTVLFQRSTQSGQFLPQIITTGQQTAAQGCVFQAVSGGPRIRFVRPWTLTAQGQAQQEAVDSGDGIAAVAPTRLVQLPDGRIALATTAPHQIPQNQLQSQQQTVIIANSSARLQMSTTSNAQIPTSTFQATAGSQQVLLRNPVLTPTQQRTTVMIAPSFSVGQTVPPITSSRLQPRLIQIRPRTPVAATTAPAASPMMSPSAIAIPVIHPSFNSNTSSVTSTGSGCVGGGLQQQSRFVVASSLRQMAPASMVRNHTHQQTLMRIVPRLPQASLAETNQVLAQPLHLQTPPPLVQPKEKILLTSTQLTSVQTLFQGANRLTRPDKAIILSFVSGKRVNPQPEGGSELRIRLSEYRERIIDAASGKVMDVAAETFIHLNYTTGMFERIKSYRTLPPDQLMALPMQPKPAAIATTSAP